MSIGIFDALAADDTQERTKARQALVLSETRIKEHLGKWLETESPTEYEARLALVKDDIQQIVHQACVETGHSHEEPIRKSLESHFRPADRPKDIALRMASVIKDACACGSPGCKCDDDCDCDAGCNCSNCSGGDKESRVAENWIQDAVKKPGQLHKDLDVPEGEKIPESKLEKAEESGSTKVKQRAQFAENMKGLNKKKSSGDGDFLVEDKTSKNWKKKYKKLKKKYDPSTQVSPDGSEISDGASVLDALEPTEKEARVGAGEQKNTDLDGPSPKMNKQRWTPKSVPHDEFDEGKNEVGDHKEDDVTKPNQAINEGPPGNIKNISEIGEKNTERVKLPTGGPESSDAGFAKGGEDFGPHTKTFPNRNQTDPVKSQSLEG